MCVEGWGIGGSISTKKIEDLGFGFCLKPEPELEPSVRVKANLRARQFLEAKKKKRNEGMSPES